MTGFVRAIGNKDMEVVRHVPLACGSMTKANESLQLGT